MSTDPIKQGQPINVAALPANHVPKNYNLNKEQVKTAQASFKAADANKSGQIPVAQLADVLINSFKSVNLPPPSNADVAFIINKYDVDHNGTISKQEFKRLLKELGGGKKYDKTTVKAPKKVKTDKKKEEKAKNKDAKNKDNKDDKHKDEKKTDKK